MKITFAKKKKRHYPTIFAFTTHYTTKKSYSYLIEYK